MSVKPQKAIITISGRPPRAGIGLIIDVVLGHVPAVNNLMPGLPAKVCEVVVLLGT